MELRQLEDFLELCKVRNFTKASENLNVAQSSITKAIQKLEDELGVRLVERSQKPLGLTEAGQKFYEKVSCALEMLNEAAEEAGAAAHKGPRKIPVLGMTTLSGVILKRMLTTPALIPHGLLYNIIERSSVEICSRLVDRELDLGWVFRKNLPDELEFIPVEVQEALLLLPPGNRLAAKREVTFEDLRGEPFAMMTEEKKAALLQLVMERCRAAGFEPQSNTVIQSFHPDANMAVECVRAGYGLSFIPEHAAEDVTDIPVLSVTPPLKFEVGLAYKKGVHLAPDTRRLMHFIVEEYPKFLKNSQTVQKRAETLC